MSLAFLARLAHNGFVCGSVSIYREEQMALQVVRCNLRGFCFGSHTPNITARLAVCQEKKCEDMEIFEGICLTIYCWSNRVAFGFDP